MRNEGVYYVALFVTEVLHLFKVHISRQVRSRGGYVDEYASQKLIKVMRN